MHLSMAELGILNKSMTSDWTLEPLLNENHFSNISILPSVLSISRSRCSVSIAQCCYFPTLSFLSPLALFPQDDIYILYILAPQRLSWCVSGLPILSSHPQFDDAPISRWSNMRTGHFSINHNAEREPGKIMQGSHTYTKPSNIAQFNFIFISFIFSSIYKISGVRM